MIIQHQLVSNGSVVVAAAAVVWWIIFACCGLSADRYPVAVELVVAVVHREHHARGAGLAGNVMMKLLLLSV